MSHRSRDFLFRACAVSAALATAFHAMAMASPAVARLEYEPGYPIWRHVIFIVIDGSLVWLFGRRPRWLVWPYALLTLQVLNGHGRGAWSLWVEHHQVDWISVAVSVAAPPSFCS
jgi:hypothetical protein